MSRVRYLHLLPGFGFVAKQAQIRWQIKSKIKWSIGNKLIFHHDPWTMD